MPLSDYSATPASNTSISGINIAEGCNASNINDAIRQLMADLANTTPYYLRASLNLSDVGNITTARTNIGAAASGVNTDITSIYVGNLGLKIKDTDGTHGLSLVAGSNLTADRALTFITGDANRNVTLTGDVSLSGTHTGTSSGTNTGDQTITLTGVVTGSGSASFATTISANAVTDGMLRQSAGLSVPGRAANTTGNVADIVASSDGHILRRSGTTLGFGTIPSSSVTGLGSLAALNTVNNGNWSGTALALGNGGSGATTPAGARAAFELGNMATANATVSTSGPSGGANGDVWYQY
jgi:hypothetical protein